MKCDKCKFQHCQSSECGTEYDCKIFGYEISKEYCQIAKKRIAAEKNTLF